MKCLVLASLLATTCDAVAGQASDELLAVFQAYLKNGEPIDAFCKSLEDVDGSVLKDVNRQLDKTWPVVSGRYFTALESVTKQGSGGARSATSGRVRDLRADFMKVYAMGEGPMKPLLKKTSMPAVMELRKLLAPTAEELVAAGPPELASLRDAAFKLGSFRDASLNAEISTTPSDSIESLRTRERELAQTAGGLPRDGLMILANNRKIAEREEIPAEEARGIEECNLWRLYVGLNALVLDPALCGAARDHSKDMAQRNFFAHESPVKGKTSPWARAANFKTTASGENIYRGSASANAANRGRFYSPGHHKNMFNAGQRRIGLGRFDKHWTQMFGR